MEEFITYLDSRINEGKTRIAALEKDGRKDDANFTRVSTNIYDVCKTVTLALTKHPGAGIGAVQTQFERFRREWGDSYEKAKDHDDVNGIAVGEAKLAALEDVIAHFEEVTKA